MTETRKVTIEIEVPVEDFGLERLLEDLKKGVPLGVREELRRSRIYAKRTRY